MTGQEEMQSVVLALTGGQLFRVCLLSKPSALSQQTKRKKAMEPIQNRNAQFLLNLPNCTNQNQHELAKHYWQFENHWLSYNLMSKLQLFPPQFQALNSNQRKSHGKRHSKAILPNEAQLDP
jgi:hypothetical protein